MSQCRYCSNNILEKAGRGRKPTQCGSVSCVKRRKNGNREFRVRREQELRSKPITRKCGGCEQEFTQEFSSKRKYRKYCSSNCSRQTVNRRVRERERAERIGALEGMPSSSCPWCRKQVAAGREDKVCCSQRCAREWCNRVRVKASSALWKRKTARIIVRDKKVCQLCFKRVRMLKAHPLSPSLDHIVPVAQGGSNDDINLQLTHLQCNMKKGNRVLGQLRIC